MNEIKLEDIEVVIFSPKLTPQDHPYFKYYDMFFNEWKKTWLNAYELMGANPDSIKLYSDELTKKDEIVAIFYKGQLVGGGINNIYDVTNPIDLSSSYFSNWSDIAIQKVKRVAINNHIFACGDFTITSSFSSKHCEFSWKAFVLVVLMERAQMQNKGIHISCTNADKQISNDGASLGGDIIVENQLFKFSNGASANVDIMVANREKISAIRNSGNPLFSMADKLLCSNKLKLNTNLELELENIMNVAKRDLRAVS